MPDLHLRFQCGAVLIGIPLEVGTSATKFQQRYTFSEMEGG
jgi:hypothetical protein